MRLSSLAKQAALQDATGRIRQIDLVRGFSIWVVVLAHAFMGVVEWEPKVGVNNLLAIFPELQWASWILQVMPLFFMAGAAANSISYSSKAGITPIYSEWIYRRISRLIAPVVWYLLAIILLAVLLEPLFEESSLRLFLNLATQMIWFLGIYILMTAATPIWVWLANRFSLTLLSGLALTALVDYLRLQNPAFGLLNFIFGWGLISVLGVRLLSEIRSPRFTRPALGLWMVFIFGTQLYLVFGIGYPLSLVGLPDADFSNMAPPSLLIVLHGINQTLLWAFFSKSLEGIAEKPRVWRAVVSTNLSAMTVYLWHLPIIMFLHVSLHILGVANPVPTTLPETFRFSLAHFTFLAFCIFIVYAWSQYVYMLENLVPPIPKAISTRNRLIVLLSPIGATSTAISLLMFSVVGPMDFPIGKGNFAGLAWSNGFTAIMLGIGLIMIWGGAKARRPKDESINYSAK